MSDSPSLREHVREHAENRPGVYRMLDADGAVVYVGKSVRVRTRLLSYFRGGRSRRAAKIVSHTDRLEWDYAPNEFAALLRELHLIKRWRPRFNRRHKADRSYCFIKLTTEAAPRLRVVSKVRDDGASYYGPFRSRSRVREAVREITDVLELRDCAARTPMRFADQQELFERDDAPLCMRADLNRCVAPCAGRCTRPEYLERVELARRFLEGTADEPLVILRRRMSAAAERLQFEYAARLRDRVQRLEAVRRDLLDLADTLTGLTFLYRVPGYDGDDRVYVIRRGRVWADVPAPTDGRGRRRLEERMQEVLGQPAPHPLTVHPHHLAEMLLVARWFRLNPDELERVQRPDEDGQGRQKSA